MKNRGIKSFALSLIVGALMVSRLASAAPMDAATRGKVEGKLPAIEAIAKDAAVVAAVKAFNTAKPAELKDMDQDKWKKLPIIDPVVRGLAKNDAGKVLKAKQEPWVGEAFLNGADGCKVALIAKTTSWCHKGKAKHDDPMKGKIWYGEVELDESSGMQMVQVGVPVKDGATVIGSLVIGVAINKL
jgi:hypothetical protein